MRENPHMAGRARLYAQSAIGGLIVAGKMASSLPQLQTGDVAGVAITWLVTVAFVAVGLALLHTDLPTVNGWACLLVAASAIPGDLNVPYYSTHGWSIVGFILEPAYMAAASALVLRYPGARLTALQRLVVWSMVGVAVVSRTGAVLTRGDAADGSHRPADQAGVSAPWLHDAVFVFAGRTLAAALLLVVAGMLFRRLQRAHGLARQAQVPLALIGGLCAAAAAVDQMEWAVGPSHFDIHADLVRNITAAMIPFALLADLLRRRAAEAAVPRRVLVAAMTGDLTKLEAAIREIFLDPTARVLIADGHGGWIDGTGRPVTPVGPPAGGRIEALNGAVGTEEQVVAVCFDPACVSDEGLISAVVSTAAAGLQNTRLHQDLLSALAEVHQSRERIVQAGIQERRQVERDLHDGAQQQFLAVAATLAQTEFVDDTAVREVVGEARTTLSSALRELRDLARGIHPPALTEQGLEAALIALGQRCTVPVSLHLSEQVNDIPGDVGTALYFFVAETLTNAVRYAEATHIEVDLTMTADSATVTVTDDGMGGAAIRPGGGLAGLTDRYAALHGSVTAQDNHPGWGSSVRATLPLSRSATS